MNPADGSANGASTSTEKNASSSTSLCQPSQPQSKEYRDLLAVADRLRKQGLSRDVDLPQIIVCGDQSSGKSSALETISGMSFPAKDNLYTRFATELILRRAPVAGIDISISPGSDLDLGRIIDDANVNCQP
jgi:hypothetical protein